MDNCSYSCNSEVELKNAYSSLEGIFSPYKLNLQQFCTNCKSLQTEIDTKFDVETGSEVKLLGSMWNRERDTLYAKDLNLDINANTKRKILCSLML